MLTIRTSDTEAVTTPVYCGFEPEKFETCIEHEWLDIPFTQAYHDDKGIWLTMQKCNLCGGQRVRMVANTKGDMDQCLQ